MRILLQSTFVLIISVACQKGFMYSQPCGTALDHPIPESYLHTISEDRIAPRTTSIDSVGLAVHLIRGSESTENTHAEFSASLDWVNDLYQNAGLYFFICEWYEEDGPGYFTRAQVEAMNEERYIDNRLNIYIVETINSNNVDLAGFGILPWIGDYDDRFVAIIREEVMHPELIAHEIGHFYGLLHTHEIARGFEWVERTNCTTTGDGFCDTPADPGLSRYNVHNCVYTGGFRDIHGRVYMPDPDLIMSYAPYNCQNRFSPEQYAHIRLNADVIHNRMVSNCSDLRDIALETQFEPVTVSFVDPIHIPVTIRHTFDDATFTDVTVYVINGPAQEEVIVHSEEIDLDPAFPGQEVIISFVLPHGIIRGEKHARIKVDGARDHFESNERNNEHKITFHVDNARFPDAAFFPNPVEDDLLLFYRELNARGATLIEIFNSTGQFIEEHVRSKQNFEFYETFDMSDMQSGVYLLRLSFPDDDIEPVIFKFVKS